MCFCFFCVIHFCIVFVLLPRTEHGLLPHVCLAAFLPGLRSWSRRRKESEVFVWSRIPKNTGSRTRIFLSDSDSGWPIESFFASHS